MAFFFSVVEFPMGQPFGILSAAKTPNHQGRNTKEQVKDILSIL